MLTRRDALVLTSGAGLAPLAAAGQPSTGTLPRLGVIVPGEPGPVTAAFIQALAEHGRVDGRTLRIEARFSPRFDELPRVAAELVALRVDAIAAIGAISARAAIQATRDIPIVFVIVIDPVAAGLVPDAQRPGGNATGATTFDPGLARGQIRILKETLPHLARVAILADAGVPDVLPRLARAAVEAEGMRPQILPVRGPTPDLDGAFAAMREERAEALLAMEAPAILPNAARIAEMAAAAGLPAMFPRDSAQRGPMLAYGTSFVAALPRMAGLVDRVLGGARAGDLPVEVVVRPELVINQRVARALGVTIPPDVLARANQVIE